MSYHKEVNLEKLLARIDDKEICDKLEIIFTTGSILDYRVVIEDTPFTSMSMLLFEPNAKYIAKHTLSFIFSRAGALNKMSYSFYQDIDIYDSNSEFISFDFLSKDFTKPLDILFDKLVNE